MESMKARGNLWTAAREPAWVELRDRISLEAVATTLLGPPAKRSGRRLFWLCRWHDDSDPSLQVDLEKARWKCWPCNLGGDAAELAMKVNGMSFPEATRWLAEQFGVITIRCSPSSRKKSSAHLQSAHTKPAARPPERPTGLPLPDAKSLVDAASERLSRPEGTEALAYLRGRGLTDETIRAARLGVVDSLSVPTRDGDRFYRVSGVIIPWHDGDRLTLIKIRRLDGREPKYLEMFRDRPSVYPDPAAIQPGMLLAVVEGEFDALLLGQELGELAPVITLGSASAPLDPSILGMTFVAAPLYVALDADPAGDKAAAGWPARAIRVRPPEGKDWTDFHATGFNRLRYFWGRFLPMSTAWETLESQRWGPALHSTPSGDDAYAADERAAIQAE
jgi:hypothetical protein